MFEQTGAHIWEERWAGDLDFYRKLFSWYVDDSKARLYVVIFSGSSQRSSPTTSFPCNYCKFGEVTVTMVTLFLVWFWVVLGAYRHPFFSIFQCGKYLLPFMSVPFLFPIPKTDFPCWEKQLNDGWGTEKNDNEEQMFPLLILMGSKKIWIKDETAFAVAKELQFETYLGRYVPDISPDWQWELILTGRLQKKSGKNRQRDFFSVSHWEIPHWAGHKIWYPRAHSAFAEKIHFGDIWFMIIGMIMQMKIWMNKWNLISSHCTLPISRSQEGNKTYSDESGERFYFAAKFLVHSRISWNFCKQIQVKWSPD